MKSTWNSFELVGFNQETDSQEIQATYRVCSWSDPLNWIIRAATIPRCNALTVGIVLWWLAGMRSERVGLVLCVERCKPFGLGRKAVERGLRDLEQAGLVRVDRNVGKCARVDLLQCSGPLGVKILPTLKCESRVARAYFRSEFLVGDESFEKFGNQPREPT